MKNVAAAASLTAAEPDWPRIEQHALELFQQYTRIQCVNPPANTAPTANLIKAELERNGLTPQLYAARARQRDSLDQQGHAGLPIASAPDPGMSRSATPLFGATRQAILKANPGAVVTPMLVPFGTGSAFLQLDAAIAATMHGDRERIPVAEFLKVIHIFYDVLASNF